MNKNLRENAINLPNLFEFNFQLRSKFKEICDEPEEMRLVHRGWRVGKQLFVKAHDETGVTFEEEVDRELFQQVGNVVVRRNVVNQSLDLQCYQN
jgi:hypothetical protein